MGNINIGGGKMEMETDATRATLSALVEAGAAFDSAWKATAAAMFANERGMGTDETAQQFRANYVPSANSLKESADNVKGIHDTFHEGGMQSVADYERVDEEGKAQLRAAGGTAATGRRV